MPVWQSAVESVFASNLFNRWTISRRPEMNTYSWPAQHHGAQTICEKLCDCVLRLGWGSELHLREQQNWLLVQRLLWASCYTSLWPFFKTRSFSSFAWNSTASPKKKKTAVKVDQFVPICSIEVNSSPVSPGYWPSQQEPPANPYTESKWERERGREGGRGLEWEGERKTADLWEKWASAERERRRPEMQRKRGRRRRGRRQSGKAEGVGEKQ